MTRALRPRGRRNREGCFASGTKVVVAVEGLAKSRKTIFNSHAVIASGERRYVELTGQCGIIECCTEEGSYYLLAMSRIGLNLPSFHDWRAALSHSYSLLRTRQDAARVSAAFPAPSCFRLSCVALLSSKLHQSSLILGTGCGLWGRGLSGGLGFGGLRR